MLTHIVGFGVRDVSGAKPVDVKILGGDLEERSNRSESERRAIFSALVGCEDAAAADAEKRYPENFNLPATEQVKRMELRSAHAKPIREACQEKVRVQYRLEDAEERLISTEGMSMRWPPLGQN